MSNGTGVPALCPRASVLGAGTGAWNKASAFLREGVSETRAVTGEKLTPYLLRSRLLASVGVEEGQAPRTLGGTLGGVAFSHLPVPTPSTAGQLLSPQPARLRGRGVPNHSRFREAALSAAEVILLTGTQSVLGDPIFKNNNSSLGVLPEE